jgi:TolA-binding protein
MSSVGLGGVIKNSGKLYLVGMVLLVAFGNTACNQLKAPASAQQKTTEPKSTDSRSDHKAPPAKVVDTRAQQLQYDKGVQAYSQEKYEEARDAFQRAIDFGPKTEVGLKAHENLMKVMQVLKTLEEIKAK